MLLLEMLINYNHVTNKTFEIQNCEISFFKIHTTNIRVFIILK